MNSVSLHKTLKQLQTKFLSLSLSTIMALSGLAGAMPLFLSQTAYAVAATTRYVNSSGSDTTDCSVQASPCRTIAYAITQAAPGDTITLDSNVTVSSEVVVDRALTIDGGGFTLNTPFAKTSNANNAGIGIQHSDVTVNNLTVNGTGGTSLHGINVYVASDVNLNSVTITNNGHAGMVVNGSTVTATNLNTSNNAWGAVNVDPGSGVTTPSVFTLNSGTLAESTQIWSDGSHVGGSATVTVNAPGYNMYKIGGTAAGYFWTNQSLTNAATITHGGVTTYYSTIPAAVAAAASGDTVNVAPGTYSNVVLNGSYASNITVSGSGSTIDGLDLTGATFNGLTFSGFTFTGDSAGYGDFSVTVSGSGSYAGLTFSGNTFDGQSQDGRGAIFLNQGFDGFSLQNNTFQNYVSVAPGSVYSIVFAEAQGAAMGDNYTASGNSLTNANAVNFLEAYRWQNVTYENNTVNTSSYGRLLVWSNDSQSLGTVNITGNTVNVAAGKGIGVYYAPSTTANVAGNSVSGASICLILDSVSDSNVTGNTFSNCATGVQLSQDGSTALDSATVTGNTFSNDTVDINKSVRVNSFNADAPVSLPVSGNQSTTSGSTTLSGSTLGTTVTASIPDGTTITASGSWNGTVNPPTTTPVIIPDTSGYATTPGIAISVGSDSVTLTFSQAVRLVLAGQAGKLVGFTEPGGSFTQITTPCNGDTQAQADAQLSGAGACYINVGSDLVVWTMHFSKFTTYTLTAKSSGGSGSSSSGSSSSGSSSSSNAVTGSVSNLVGVGGLFSSETAGAAASALNPSTKSGGISGAKASVSSAGSAINRLSTGLRHLKWYWWVLAALLVVAVIAYYVRNKKNGGQKSSGN